MESLQDKVARVVREHLADGEADLETFGDKIGGHYISSDFYDKTYDERRKMLRRLFAEHLTAEEADRIGPLLTYTPAEWNVPLEMGEAS